MSIKTTTLQPQASHSRRHHGKLTCFLKSSWVVGVLHDFLSGNKHCLTICRCHLTRSLKKYKTYHHTKRTRILQLLSMIYPIKYYSGIFRDVTSMIAKWKCRVQSGHDFVNFFQMHLCRKEFWLPSLLNRECQLSNDRCKTNAEHRHRHHKIETSKTATQCASWRTKTNKNGW